MSGTGVADRFAGYFYEVCRVLSIGYKAAKFFIFFYLKSMELSV
jgi:hypothetical protein